MTINGLTKTQFSAYLIREYLIQNTHKASSSADKSPLNNELLNKIINKLFFLIQSMEIEELLMFNELCLASDKQELKINGYLR